MDRRPDEQREEAPRGERREARGRSRSMHDGVGHWCDCCPCEAEPRWRALGEELGIELNDYEEDL